MLSPCELAVLINAAAIAVAEGKSVQELDLLAILFTRLGDTLATIAVQQANIEACKSQTSDE